MAYPGLGVAGRAVLRDTARATAKSVAEIGVIGVVTQRRLETPQ